MQRENGGSIVTLKAEDLLLYDKAMESSQDVLTFPISNSKRRILERNYENYKKRQNDGFDYSILNDGCTSEEYKNRCILVRSLINKGFSLGQLEVVIPLILEGMDLNMITSLFNKDADIKEIENFVKAI